MTKHKTVDADRESIQIAKFLKSKRRFLKYSELETSCGIATGTLSHVARGARPFPKKHINAILPKIILFGYQRVTD